MCSIREQGRIDHLIDNHDNDQDSSPMSSLLMIVLWHLQLQLGLPTKPAIRADASTPYTCTT
eukprot:1158303-Pelagomonas_calceolata.AAC.1